MGAITTNLTNVELQQCVTGFLNGQTSHDLLAKQLGLSKDDTTRLLLKAARFYGETLTATATISLEPPGNAADAVGEEDFVIVSSDKLRINYLFSDIERDISAQPFKDGRRQEGSFTFDVNGQSNSFSWQRRWRSGYWQDHVSDDCSILFAGTTGQMMSLQADLQESEASEAELLDRIVAALGFAATTVGLVPGVGTLVSAGISLGVAIAQLVKANLDDDHELAYVGCMGELGPGSVPIRYGKYQLNRNSGTTANDIEFDFSIGELDVTSTEDKRLQVVLHSVDLSGLGSEGIGIEKLENDDRVLIEATMTSPPELEPETDPTINAFSFLHPYIQKKDVTLPRTVPFENVVKINNQLLYDGPWIPAVGFSFGVTAIPREFNTEEWLDVLASTGEFISSAVGGDAGPGIRIGFQIAQNAAVFLSKYLPDIRFAVNRRGMFINEGAYDSHDASNPAVPECFIEIDGDNTTDWQSKTIVLRPDGYNAVEFSLSIKVSNA